MDDIHYLMILRLIRAVEGANEPETGEIATDSVFFLYFSKYSTKNRQWPNKVKHRTKTRAMQ